MEDEIVLVRPAERTAPDGSEEILAGVEESAEVNVVAGRWGVAFVTMRILIVETDSMIVRHRTPAVEIFQIPLRAEADVTRSLKPNPENM